ncbi:MAG: hypothetical protein C0179_04840 [Fervidicoccus sp.]|nr:MAG: hypothetical protein C0179_04840 [Fervidicoccus sp.]
MRGWGVGRMCEKRCGREYSLAFSLASGVLGGLFGHFAESGDIFATVAVVAVLVLSNIDDDFRLCDEIFDHVPFFATGLWLYFIAEIIWAHVIPALRSLICLICG